MKSILIYATLFASTQFISCKSEEKSENQQRPNILFAISDDQSFAHTSFAGAKFVNTPAFDQVAKECNYFKS